MLLGLKAPSPPVALLAPPGSRSYLFGWSYHAPPFVLSSVITPLALHLSESPTTGQSSSTSHAARRHGEHRRGTSVRPIGSTGSSFVMHDVTMS